MIMLNRSFLTEAVFIDNRNNILDTTAFHKSTCSALLLFFNSYPSRFYKISLIKYLIDSKKL